MLYSFKFEAFMHSDRGLISSKLQLRPNYDF